MQHDQVAGQDRPVMVETVDEGGASLGTAEKLTAHHLPGLLHRAFSCFLFDPHGRLLLQQRATSKYHSGGKWSNSCCGHPAQGEDPIAATTRRCREELGVRIEHPAEVGTTQYCLVDPGTNLVEREHNHLIVARVDATTLRPDPAEVQDFIFATPDILAAMRRHAEFTVWFDAVSDIALQRIGKEYSELPWSTAAC